MDMNKVMLAGNLARAPETRQLQSGQEVGKFALAVHERYSTAQGEERDDVCFVDIEVWGKLAANCRQYLDKGAPAFVEGRLRAEEWEDRQTGQKRRRLVVRADRVQFLGRNGAGQRPAATTPAEDRRPPPPAGRPANTPPSRNRQTA
ncbi:MAG: Single-stranded DNA-binding protein [Lentisphaerae bacterium ADurb.BinA184]|nr:MAG: Single-stranded DNA-binding protein [Lentisphaerae bacterium ADurb.BinA184]